MRPFLVRFWPYGPLVVTAAGAAWYATWPWIAGLAACGLAAWAWELERRADVLAYRWGNRADQRSLPALPRRRLPALPVDGRPLSTDEKTRWLGIVIGHVDSAPEPVYPQQRNGEAP